MVILWLPVVGGRFYQSLYIHTLCFLLHNFFSITVRYNIIHDTHSVLCMLSTHILCSASFLHNLHSTAVRYKMLYNTHSVLHTLSTHSLLFLLAQILLAQQHDMTSCTIHLVYYTNCQHTHSLLPVECTTCTQLKVHYIIQSCNSRCTISHNPVTTGVMRRYTKAAVSNSPFVRGSLGEGGRGGAGR